MDNIKKLVRLWRYLCFFNCRGRRMRNSNVNINLGAGGAMVETGHNADSRPSSTESCKSNPSASDSLNYKDMLVQFAKISQQGKLSRIFRLIEFISIEYQRNNSQLFVFRWINQGTAELSRCDASSCDSFICREYISADWLVTPRDSNKSANTEIHNFFTYFSEITHRAWKRKEFSSSRSSSSGGGVSIHVAAKCCDSAPFADIPRL